MRNVYFKDNLNRALRKSGYTQNELSKKVNISKSLISRYLSGELEPREEYLDKISSTLNVSKEWLLSDNNLKSRVEYMVEELEKETQKGHALYLRIVPKSDIGIKLRISREQNKISITKLVEKLNELSDKNFTTNDIKLIESGKGKIEDTDFLNYAKIVGFIITDEDINTTYLTSKKTYILNATSLTLIQEEIIDDVRNLSDTLLVEVKHYIDYLKSRK